MTENQIKTNIELKTKDRIHLETLQASPSLCCSILGFSL